MKNQMFFFFLVSLIFLTSCQKHELVYSCDPAINMQVIKNMQQIKDMEAGSWQAINDLEYQRGVYRAFSSEQKLSLWMHKLQNALTLTWTDEEKAHIETLISFLGIDVLEGDIDDITYIKLYKWINYGLEVLKWNQEIIYSLVYTPQLLSSNKKIPATYFVTAKTRSEDIGRKTCNCGDAHGVLSCYHPYASYNCHVEDCEPGRGCGMFWAEKCWGVCYA